MHILAEGYGTWDGNVVNPRNPARRDVHILHNAKQDGTPSYMVMQVEADNPGVWREYLPTCHLSRFKTTWKIISTDIFDSHSFPLPRSLAHVRRALRQLHLVPG